MEEAEGSPGPAPQALSAEDMVALATALLPSLLRQQTHIPRVDLSSQLSNFLQRAGVIGTGYRSDNVGYPIPDPERRMTIEEEGMEWVAKWVRAARPDLTDACTHGVALALLSLGSRTWFQQGTEGALWVDKAVGDAIVVSEEAVAAFYATPHSNCVVKALHIEGAAFGTPFSNSPSSDSSENSLLLPLAAIAPPPASCQHDKEER